MSDIDTLLFEHCQADGKKEPHPMCVVRLTTSTWKDSNGVYIKKSLRFLRRKCIGFNILDEDCSMTGANEVVEHITNLSACDDGIYQVVTCNEWASYETPHIIEDYDYKLIPFVEDLK